MHDEFMEVDPKTSARMKRVRSRDTLAELALRRELHRRGRRFFVQRHILRDRRTVDIVFPTAKLAVFVDGCFWHACPLHGTQSHTNTVWWQEKLARNVQRDRCTDNQLQAAGWNVIRVWEHENASDAADRVEIALRKTASRDGRVHSSGPSRLAVLPPPDAGKG